MSNEINSPGNILDAEKELRIKMLERTFDELEKENTKLKILLKDYGVDAHADDVTDEEAICVLQISKLRERASSRMLTLDETRQLDLLHKNLKLARGETVRTKKKVTKLSTTELLDRLKSDD